MSFLYGNHNGRSIHFIKQYHVVGLVQLKLKSMIKGKGAFSVNGVYYGTEKRTHIINSTEPLLLPRENSSTNRHLQDNSNQSSCSSTETKLKGKQLGEGCNILSVVRKLLSEPENWFKCEKLKVISFLVSSLLLHHNNYGILKMYIIFSSHVMTLISYGRIFNSQKGS